MRKVTAFLSFLALAVALPAGAQMQPKSLNRITIIKPKPGMAFQWAEGLKKVNEWAHQHNLPLAHYVWSIVSGPRTGQYAVGVLDHDWKDFDVADKASHGVMEQVVADLEPYTESHLTSYWVYREDLTGHPENTGQAPSPFLTVTTYFLKPNGMPAVTDVIKAINAAIQKSHWPGKPSEWYSLVNGGFGGQLALITRYENWADFQPPVPGFFKMISEVYGQEGSSALGKKFNSSVRGRRTEIWRYRPDLSYIPASH